MSTSKPRLMRQYQKRLKQNVADNLHPLKMAQTQQSL
jgi:hypothetical protein